MKVLNSLIALCFMISTACASQEGAMRFSNFHIESDGIGSSGPLAVDGKRDGNGMFEMLSVSFAGNHISIPLSVSENIPVHANSIQVSYIRLNEVDGGRTVFLVFQTGFLSGEEPLEKFIISVNEAGVVDIVVK